MKYGKCVSVKRSVPCKPIMTELRNRFQCLQDCVVGDDMIHDDIHLNNLENHRDASVHVGAVSERIKHKKQHSEECKISLSGSNDMLRPKLAFKQNCSLEGNKNKTGLLDVVSYNIEELDNDSALIEKQDFSGALTLTNTLDERNPYEMQAGKKFGPQLAPGNSFLDGNKNKTGVFDGDRSHVSIMEASQQISQTAITAGASNQVATEILQPDLHGNCGLNICETMQCGNDYMEIYTKQKYCNMVNNSEHDFGFCPLTNLTLYEGSPVHWEHIPDDLQAHEFIKNTGKPNFLAARIPVYSHLNIDKWRAYLAQYWDVQLLDLLQYGFPLDASRENEFISTEVNHTSALQNVHHVQSYLDEELKFCAILGPFRQKPIPLHVSPLMVRDKQDSSTKRTIIRLKLAKGGLCEYGSPKRHILRYTVYLKLPLYRFYH